MKDLFDNFCSLVEWKTSPAQEHAWLSPGRNNIPDKAMCARPTLSLKEFPGQWT